MTPLGVIFATVFLSAVYQRFPSGPGVMSRGKSTGFGNSTVDPDVVVWPILPVPANSSVHHRSPSGPAVMPYGALLANGYSCRIVPDVLMTPSFLLSCSASQMLPSAPGVAV